MVEVAQPPPVQAEGDRFRVLVVEDSLDHQMLMVRRLQQEGLEVVAASTAREALVMAADADLVLLDYRLPGHTGLEVMAAIREHDRPPAVVMVTGMGSTDVAVDAMRAGAVDYVTKDRGYLETLPEVVRRAWRTHDLSERATELQRLALLVTSASDRDDLFAEIAAGSQHLLRATACALLLVHGDELEVATSVGADVGELDTVVQVDVADFAGHGQPAVADDRLLVPLPRDDGGVPVGVLALWRSGRSWAGGELELAKAFASFAGLALQNMRQRELEANLMAELQQTVDARRDFIASVSHELRTPLTCISGFVQTMQTGWARMDESQLRDMLARIGRNAQDLEGLVEELIDLAALDRGETVITELESAALGPMLGQAIDDVAEMLGDRDVQVDADVTAVLDVGLFRRVMRNLLTNAVKFSDRGTAIEVRAGIDGDQVRVSVTDHGIGMEPRQAARVFDPFFRANPSVANAVRGSGIGLALVREYVRTMGGSVGVDSTPGVGSTFWFTLPRPDAD